MKRKKLHEFYIYDESSGKEVRSFITVFEDGSWSTNYSLRDLDVAIQQRRDVSNNWYANNKERKYETQKEWRWKNPEKQKEYSKRWLAKNPDYHNEYNRRNREHVNKKWRRYYWRNHEHVLELKREWREENYEKYLEILRRFRENNREYLAERARRYREENPEKWQEIIKRYRRRNRHKLRLKSREWNSKRRRLGFIPLNYWFEGSEAHHVDEEHVVYIPAEIHQSIYHCLESGEGMAEINEVAFRFLESERRQVSKLEEFVEV